MHLNEGRDFFFFLVYVITAEFLELKIIPDTKTDSISV